VSRKDAPAPEAGQLVTAVGAVIFASDEPVPASELAEAFGGMDEAQIEAAIRALAEVHEGSDSGLRVEKVAGGYRLATRPEVGALVRQFMRRRNRARLSAAALETLAIVAYRQPVTIPEIQAIRGKDPTAALKNLLDKRLLRILGKKKVVGSPLLYGTSRQFLVHFGLNSLDDLPSIEEFEGFVDVLEGGPGELLAGGGTESHEEQEPPDPSEAGQPVEPDPEEPGAADRGGDETWSA
jgi:segregation and condensation protein B